MKRKDSGIARIIIMLLVAFAIAMAVYYLPGTNLQKTTTTTQNYPTMTYYSGQKVSNFLIVQINPDNVTGLSYILYPVAQLNGITTTLYLGNTVGYNCDGSLKILIAINYNSVTFANISTGSRVGECPI